MARDALLIFNPAAGQARLRGLPGRIVAGLGAAGVKADLAPTSAPGDATSIAREAAVEGLETIYVLGGDGTFREAAQGLVGTDTALGTLPGGTINVVPWSLGLPTNPVRAASALAAGTTTEIDVGLCDEKVFLILTSVGLDGRVMARVGRNLKRHLGRVAVGARGFIDWLTYSYPAARVVADGKEIDCTFAAICNLPHYGGSTLLAPRASPTSGRLELIAFRGRGRAATLGFAYDLLRGRHTERPDVDALTVDEVTIEGPPDLPLEIDGDGLILGPPHRLRLAADRLKILTPV